jgi:hypothetical protein
MATFGFRFPGVLAIAGTLCGAVAAGELRVHTDFEGGSATVQAIDQDSGVIRFTPGGDPQRGWPCWWYLRVEGAEPDREVVLSLAGSERPARNNGLETGKPLANNWAMPIRAAVSTDGKTWRHTEPGRRAGARIDYRVTGTGGPLWIAWGPPFTPNDTDALLAMAEGASPAAKAFELTQSKGGRAIRALRVSEAEAPTSPAIWVQARQHAWESGASWVARGFVEWLTGADEDAVWLRRTAEVIVVPIMDVDNVATGNGGKEAAPRDHNRDWDDHPVYPEVAAAQKHLRERAEASRLSLFLDLHNPGPGDTRPFFFMGPEELLDPAARQNRARFLASTVRHINGPLPVEANPRITGPGYHPLWKQISGQWVNALTGSAAVAVCLETAWNTPHSTTDGYRHVGRQLGEAVAEFMRGEPGNAPNVSASNAAPP